MSGCTSQLYIYQLLRCIFSLTNGKFSPVAYLKGVDAGVHPSLLNVCDLLPDAEQGVAEPIQLSLVFWLCGLNHEGAGHWPRHGGSMETWTPAQQKTHKSKLAFISVKGKLRFLGVYPIIQNPHVRQEHRCLNRLCTFSRWPWSRLVLAHSTEVVGIHLCRPLKPLKHIRKSREHSIYMLWPCGDCHIHDCMVWLVTAL